MLRVSDNCLSALIRPHVESRLTELPEGTHVGEDGLDLLSYDTLSNLLDSVADLGISDPARRLVQ